MANLLKFDLYFFACLIFCAYNAYILVNNGRKSVYKTMENQADFIHLSFCIELVDYDCHAIAFANRTAACQKLRGLTEFFKQNRTPQQIIQMAKGYRLEEFFSFASGRKVGNSLYYLNFRSICLAYQVEVRLGKDETEYAEVDLVNNFKVDSKILFHGQEPSPFVTRGYYFECVQFVSCTSFTITIKSFKLILLPKPFSPACKNYSRLTFNFTRFEQIPSRSNCIMECLKQTARLSRFYYSENDTAVLSYSSSHQAMSFMKRGYSKCLEICESPDCESQNYFVFGFQFQKILDKAKIRHHHLAMSYEAIPYISEYTFYLQFLGQISLVFGTSMLTLLLKAERLYAESRRLKSVLHLNTITLSTIKTAVIVVSVLVGVYLEVGYWQFFKGSSNNSTLFHALTPIYPTPFSVVVCFNLSQCGLQVWPHSKIESLSLAQFEAQVSCNFKFITTRPDVLFEQYRRPIRSLKERSIYRRIGNEYFKCFSMSIEISEPRYKSILFGSFVSINISASAFQYLTDGRKRLDNRTKILRYGFKLKLVSRKFRNFEPCENYTLAQHGCDSFDNCLDRCYVLGFAKKYGTIQFGSTPVYAEYFANNENLKFNLSAQVDKDIQQECWRFYKYKECDKSYISSHDKQISEEIMKQNDTLIINLLFEQNVITFILITNPWELTFHILTLGSVLFGFSVPNLLFFLYELTKLQLLRFLILRKVLLTISFVGFAFHSFFILQDSLYSDLIPEFTANFSFLEPNKHLPVLVFCVNHPVDIDALPSLTGQQLDEMTKDIDQKHVFERIIFFDNDYNRQDWSPNQKLPENLNIVYFFINRLKCFEVHYRLNPNNIYSSYVYNILEVVLNQSVDTYLFSYRTNDSLNLIDYYEFKANQSVYCNFDYMHEEFRDQFQWIKSPTLLYRQLVGDDKIKKTDISRYINELKVRLLAKSNYTTSLMPLYREDFGHKIDNDGFENMIRYNVEIRETLSVSDENYKRGYFNMLPSFDDDDNKTMVALKKIFLHGNLNMANKDDYPAVMCNLLNALSVWLAASLIDLTHHLRRLRLSARLRLLCRSWMSRLRELARFCRRRNSRQSPTQFKRAYRVALMRDFQVTLIDQNGNRVLLR